MKTLFLTFIIFCFNFCTFVNAQTSIDTVFCNSKSDALGFLNLNARLDLLDYYNSNIQFAVENEFKEKSSIISKSEHLIRLKMTDVSKCEVLLLDSIAGDSLYAVLHVIEKPIGFIQLEIRSKSEQLINKQLITPSINEAIDASAFTKEEMELFAIGGWTATFKDEKSLLIVQPVLENIPLLLRERVQQKLSPISYYFNGERFVAVEL